MNYFGWFKLSQIWCYNYPPTNGRYVVRTKSPMLDTEYSMYADFKILKSGQPSWSFNNQQFIAYLK